MLLLEAQGGNGTFKTLSISFENQNVLPHENNFSNTRFVSKIIWNGLFLIIHEMLSTHKLLSRIVNK